MHFLQPSQPEKEEENQLLWPLKQLRQIILKLGGMAYCQSTGLGTDFSGFPHLLKQGLKGPNSQN